MKSNLSWKNFFLEIKEKEYYKNLIKFLENERKHHVIYPKKDNVFNAFKLTSFNDVKVVILGQDPYINKNEAMGLAFSVNKGIKLPPSLKNIYKEIELEYKNLNKKMDYSNGDLTYLAKQGVFLINTILTVREKESLSHNNKEYKLFFNDLMNYIDKNNNHIVFIFLGNKAYTYKKYVLNKNRLIINASHPSPLSANRGGFFNSDIFIDTNKYLKENGLKEINRFNN